MSAARGLARDRGLSLIIAWKLVKGGALSLLALALGAGFPSGRSVAIARRLAAALEQNFSSTLLREVSGWLVAHVNQVTMGATTVLLAMDGTLSLIQGLGLHWRRRWAAWLTVISTSLLVPVEIWHLSRHPEWSRVAVLAANVAIVAYLAARVRRQHEWVEDP